MADIQEIDKAVGAHGMWKMRLKTAVSTGKKEVADSLLAGDSADVSMKLTTAMIAWKKISK